MFNYPARNQNDAAKLTLDGGYAVRYINKTGGASVKGTLVSSSQSVANAVIAQTNTYDSIGVIYEDGIADGSLVWVVVSGRAQVLYKNDTNATVGNILVADAVDGRASDLANPGGGLPGTDTHFTECGHVLETKTGGTNVLVYVNLHFN